MPEPRKVTLSQVRAAQALIDMGRGTPATKAIANAKRVTMSDTVDVGIKRKGLTKGENITITKSHSGHKLRKASSLPPKKRVKVTKISQLKQARRESTKASD
ncbi:hypothetical protein ACWKWA_14795 [Dermacoccus abyssi]